MCRLCNTIHHCYKKTARVRLIKNVLSLLPYQENSIAKHQLTALPKTTKQ